MLISASGQIAGNEGKVARAEREKNVEKGLISEESIFSIGFSKIKIKVK